MSAYACEKPQPRGEGYKTAGLTTLLLTDNSQLTTQQKEGANERNIE